MGTTINSYSVGLGLNPSGMISGAKLARSEMSSLVKTLKDMQTPADVFNREVDVLNKALENGTISIHKHQAALTHLEQKYMAAANSARVMTDVEKQYAAAIERTIKFEHSAAEAKSKRWTGGAAQSSGMQTAGMAIGGQVGGLMSMGAKVAVPVGIGLAIKETLSLASAAEQAQAKFEVLSGSVGTASALVVAMKKLDAETPLNFTSIQKGASTIMQYGIANSEVMPLMRAMGEITGGNTERFERMSLAVGQVNAAGRLMAQEVLQMINAGFNPLQEISRTTGKSMVELKDAMKKGEISSQMFKDALISATSEGGRFNGMLDRLKDTGEGAWNKTISDLQKIGMQIGEGIIPVAVELLGMFRSILPILQPIAAVIEVWGDGMSILIGYTSDLLEDLIAIFTLDFKKGIGAWVHGNTAFQKVIDEQNEIVGIIEDQETGIGNVVAKTQEQLDMEERKAKFAKDQADWTEKNAKAFESVMGPLQKQLDVYILGEQAAKRSELSQQSITFEQIKQIEAAEKQLKILNAQKEATEKAEADKKKALEETAKYVEDLKKQGQSLTEKSNPVAAVSKQLADLKVLLGVNAIDTKTFTIEQNRILAEAAKAGKEDIKAPASLDVGSQEAYRFMVDAQNDRLNQQLQKMEEQKILQLTSIDAQRTANEILKKIAEGNVKRIR